MLELDTVLFPLSVTSWKLFFFAPANFGLWAKSD